MQQHPAADRPAIRPESSPGTDDPAAWPLDRLLSAAALRVERDWAGHLSTWGLTPAGLPVLVMLLGGPLTQTELAAGCGVSEQSMSRLLTRLEHTGHLRRTPHRLDRRKHQVDLTEAGREAAVRATDHHSADHLAARGLTADQAATLRALLAIVADPAR